MQRLISHGRMTVNDEKYGSEGGSSVRAAVVPVIFRKIMTEQKFSLRQPYIH